MKMKTYLLALGILACALSPASSLFTRLNPQTLINGTEVDKTLRPDIVTITTGNSACTAAVVGPRVVVTAAHCGTSNARTVFTTNGNEYHGKFHRSALYARQGHDVAVVITSRDIDLGGMQYSVVNTTVAPELGSNLILVGYGCTEPGGGGGGNDGTLRAGYAQIIGFSNFDIVSRGGAALCFGDSGGPGYMKINGRMMQMSVNSKGNIRDINYTTRLDVRESREFFEHVTSRYGVEICGVNKEC